MKTEQDPEFSKELAPKRYSAYLDAEAPSLPPAPGPAAPYDRKGGGDAGIGFRRSLIFHGVLSFAFLIFPQITRFFGLESESVARLKAQEAVRTAIRVDVVDLPRMKVTDLQNIDLSEEVNKDLKETQEAETKPVSESAMVDRSKEAPKTADTPPAKPAKVDRIKELQDRLRADQKRRDAIAKLQGKGKDSKSGRPEMAGNIVSEGYSSTGSVATAADAYNGKAKSHLQRNWRVPGWITAGTLKARIVVKIAPNGRVLFKQFSRKSGNAEFDDSVARAVDAADPFPPTPENLKLSYMEDGVEFGFPE